MADPVRTAAWAGMRAVNDRDAYANLVLPSILSERNITGRDAAFATELLHGTLRMRGQYDAVIDHVATAGMGAIDKAVLDALRLGAHQLLAMRVPPHAAVSETVDVVRSQIGHKPVGFANAVLRKIGQCDLAQWLDIVTAGLTGDAALATRSSHPVWIIEALRSAVGPDQLEPLLAAQNTSPRVTLVARPGLCEPADLPGTSGLVSPYARVLDSGDPGQIAQVVAGSAAVQDEGSQMVAITAANAEVEGRDERWLDLCAGPGGKAALWGAIAAGRGARVVANEPQAHRANLVRQSVRRLSNVEVVEFDGRAGSWESASFDRVLVDAPCTGLGALRRRPESRWRRQPTDLDELVPLQRELCLRALDLVRPGGIVTYATCSPHLAETDDVINAVTATTGATLVASHRWWPHLHGTDAMYAACMRRR